MKLATELFWDTNYNKIEWDKNNHYVICRVLEYGGIDDWREIRKYYGDKKIIEVAKSARYLSKKTTYFIHHILNIPLKEIRCYRLMQSHPEQWIF